MNTIIEDLFDLYKTRLLRDVPKLTIGISGASGSGKTWFAKKIKNIQPNLVSIFTLDNYYKDVDYIRTLEYQHDNPHAVNYDKAFEDLDSLLNGNDIKMPIYDYNTHKIVDEKICTPTSLIICDGIFLFCNEKIRNRMDLKIWIETEENIRLERRINRDIKERGDNVEEVRKRYYRDVEPAYIKYIVQYKKYADLIYLNNCTNENYTPPIVKSLADFLERIN